jgi:hypothetical protein
MKHKFKRKVLLMSMAVAASLPAGAFAEAGSKSERIGTLYSNGGRGALLSAPIDVIEEAPEMRIKDEGLGIPSKLFGKLKGMAESLSSRMEAVSSIDQGAAWKLEMSQAETPKLGSTDNPRVTPVNPVGVALRLKF